MKQNFEAALAFTLKEEGGYSNNPRDPGGRTDHGITQRELNAVRAKLQIAASDVTALTSADISLIYKSEYWDRVSGDTLPAGTDLVMFDIAVMSGPNEALLFYRHGAHTPEALNETHLAFLRRLTTFSTFGNGWSRRIGARNNAAAYLLRLPLTAKPMPATVPQRDKQPATTEKSTMEKLMMLPSVAGSLIGLCVKYGPQAASSVATAVTSFPDIEAKGTDMIARLKKFDVPGAMVDFNAILADLGLNQSHVTTATATAAQTGASLAPSIF